MYHGGMAPDLLAGLREALERTTPRLILLVCGAAVTAYGAAYATNAVLAPIELEGAVWFGAALIVLIAGIAGAYQAAVALATARSLPPAGPTQDTFVHGAAGAVLLAIAGATVLLLDAILGPFASIPLMVVWAWLLPHAFLHVASTSDITPLGVLGALGRTVRAPLATLPAALIAIALVAVGIATVIGWLYTLPLASVILAVTHRDEIAA